MAWFSRDQYCVFLTVTIAIFPLYQILCCVGQEQCHCEVSKMKSYLGTEKKITEDSCWRRHRRFSLSCSRREGGIAARRWQCRLLLLAVVVTAMASCRRASASSNPLELNGGSCLAMAGKGCVALAVDRRFGLEGQLVSADAKRVLKVRCAYSTNYRYYSCTLKIVVVLLLILLVLYYCLWRYYCSLRCCHAVQCPIYGDAGPCMSSPDNKWVFFPDLGTLWR